MTEEEKAQIEKWYEQTKQLAASSNMAGVQGMYQQAVQRPWAIPITGSGNINIGPTSVWPQTTSITLAPAPARDLRIEYLEERVEELSQQLARSDSDRARAIAMERVAAMKVIMLHRLEDFLRNSHPDVLAHFDEVQSAIKRMTT